MVDLNGTMDPGTPEDEVWILMESGYKIKNKSPVVMLFSRSYKNPKVTTTHELKGFRPYFWAPMNEMPDIPNGCEYSDEIVLDALNRQVRKVYTDVPSTVKKIRDRYSFTDMADFLFEKRAMADYNITYAYKWVNDKPVPVEVPDILLPRIMYADIEVLSPGGVFPDSVNAKFPVVSIQMLDSYTNDITIITSSNLWVDNKQYNIPQTTHDDHIACRNEQELFKVFQEYIAMTNPDVISFWNGDLYDLPYLIRRAKNLEVPIHGLGRYGSPIAVYEPLEDEFSLRIPGRSTLDMMSAFKVFMKQKAQRESYDLKSVSADYGFPYADYGYKLAETLGNGDIETFLQYCRNDVIALKTIDNHKDIGLFKFYETLRKIAGCKLDNTLHNSVIIESLLIKYGIAPMPTKQIGERREFEGALVLDPPAGIFEMVGTVDLAALYPTVMRAFPDRCCPDPNYKVIEVLEIVVNERERYRAINKTPESNEMTKLIEYIFKVLANSFYGALGLQSFRLFKYECASSVCEIGREVDRFVHSCLLKHGKRTIYSDSVIGNSTVKIYNSFGDSKYTTMESLFTQVDFTRGEKEYCNLEDVFVESIDDNGKLVLDKVPYIMRHKTDKQLYNIAINNCWDITVTEDHSVFVYTNVLLRENNYMIKTIPAKEIGDIYKSVIIRRSSFPNSSIVSLNENTKFYEYMGYHLANGTLHYNKYGKAYYGGISFGLDDEILYNYFIPYLQETKQITSNMYKDKRGKNDYRYSGLKLVRFIESTIGHSKNKKVPDYIFNESIENIKAFIRGYFTGDGTVIIRNDFPIIRVTCIHKSILSDIQKLLFICGIPSTYFRENSPNSYNGKISETYSHHLVIGDINKFKTDIGFITSRKQEKINYNGSYKVDDKFDWSYSNQTKVTKLDYTCDYVYDLHTQNYHRYFADDILVHNTDSSFFYPVVDENDGLLIQEKLNKDLIEWGKEKGARVNFSLKFEKLYKRILFKKDVDHKKKYSWDEDQGKKKKYAGYLIWKEGKSAEYLKEHGEDLNYMGLELVRSDNSKFTKEILREFFNILLIEGDVPKASQYIKASYKRVKNGEVDYREVSIPKDVRKATKTDNPWKRGIENTKQVFNYIIPDGTKPRLIFVTEYPYELCVDDELDIGDWKNKIDWEKTLEKTVTKKLKIYAESAGISWDYFVHGQQNMEQWF